MKIISRPSLAAGMAFLLAVLLLPALRTGALAAQSFVVLPFTVNAPQSYSYLGSAVPSSLRTKLSRPGAVQGTMGSVAATSSQKAKSLMGRADVAIWGKVDVLGNECVITASSVDRAGKTWTRTVTGQVSALTSVVSDLGTAMSAEVFGLPSAGMGAGMGAGRAAPGRSGDIIVNETGDQRQQGVYLNPQFRYQGADGDQSRLRTRRIKEKMVDMAVGDFNGDGKNEVAVLTEHNILIYSWMSGGDLQPLGSMRIPGTNNTFSMRAMDINRDRAEDLVVVTYDEESNRPYTFFFGFKGNKFSQIAERANFFVSVMRLPPSLSPALVGQRWDSVRLFAPGVHTASLQGGKIVLGGRISLPSGATVFNCAWIPAGRGNKVDQLVMLTDDERIKVFQGTGQSLIHTTMERYSGSSVGMDFYKSMPGLDVNKTYQLPSKVFAPMRLLVADIGRTGDSTLLVNHPVSTASQFFDRYRYFPQGEIHALYWDGVGLGLKWKTRRIRGSVAEVDLADVNNDGVLDLVVGINTSPELGIGGRQSMITAYPLDVSRTDPSTPADLSDFEVAPGR